MRADEFEPVRADEFEPVRADEFEPVRADEFEPVRADEFEPVRADEFEPVRADEFEPVRADANKRHHHHQCGSEWKPEGPRLRPLSERNQKGQVQRARTCTSCRAGGGEGIDVGLHHLVNPLPHLHESWV